MTAFYNDIDAYCCAWLSNLMDAGLITPGRIDDRPIQELTPADVRGYERVHFFAGAGGWDEALNLAGWSGPVWTGSCPCQPFSKAGSGKGFGDGRHLWPNWAGLIRECRPDVLFGEQVSGDDGLAWLDFVSADLENCGYAVGSMAACAAGVGAPHVRQRVYFVADAERNRRKARGGNERGAEVSWGEHRDHLVGRGGMGHASSTGLPACQPSELSGAWRREEGRTVGEPGPVNGFWEHAEWIGCRDGKARPVEPGTFALAYGVPARVGRLRATGNAIVPQQAAAVVKAFMSLKGLDQGRLRHHGACGMTHRWHWRKWLPERHGQLCRVLAVGRMNSALVEFQDGYRVLTSRYAVRKIQEEA